MSVEQQSTILALQAAFDQFVDNANCQECDNQAMRGLLCCVSGRVHLIPLCYDCEIEECYHADGQTGIPYPITVGRNGKDINADDEPLESTQFKDLLKEIETFAKGPTEQTICVECKSTADYLIMCDACEDNPNLPHVSGVCKDHIDYVVVVGDEVTNVNPDESHNCPNGGELVEIIDRTGTVIDVATIVS